LQPATLQPCSLQPCNPQLATLHALACSAPWGLQPYSAQPVACNLAHHSWAAPGTLRVCACAQSHAHLRREICTKELSPRPLAETRPAIDTIPSVCVVHCSNVSLQRHGHDDDRRRAPHHLLQTSRGPRPSHPKHFVCYRFQEIRCRRHLTKECWSRPCLSNMSSGNELLETKFDKTMHGFHVSRKLCQGSE
jgi:hypothetical protein